MDSRKNDESGLLGGKTCLVTGATSGVGLATARALAARGANVIGMGRDPGRAARARDSISAAVGPGAWVRYDVLDLSDLRAVDAYVKGFGAGRGGSPDKVPGAEGPAGPGDLGGLDAVVNCAGFYADRRVGSADGYEMQFAVNHLAHFLLTTGLLPLLAKSSDARVVTVSSGSHYHGRMHWKALERMLRGERPLWPYVGVGAYGESKLANVLFTAELARRVGKAPITTFAADPGLVNTEMGQKQGFSLGSLFWSMRRRFGASPESPAEAIAWLVSEPSLAGKTGLYWKEKAAVAPAPRAQDAQAACRLWTLSEALVAAALEGRKR